MRFGKREQIGLLGVSAILAIGLLHLMVFGPKATEFAEVQKNLDRAKKAGENVALLEKPSDLVLFRQTTQEVMAGYDDVLTSLGLTRPTAFYEPTLLSVQLPPIDEKMAPADREALLANMAALAIAEKSKERKEEQVQLVFAEIRRLRQFAPNAVDTPYRGKTKFPFLANDWKIPLTLPEGARGARLRDNIREALGTREIIAMIGTGQEALRKQQEDQFAAKIREIGIDNTMYADPAAGGLANFGQFVPLIHKLSLAMMLEQEIEATKDVGGEEIDRAKLYDVIELHLPQESLLNTSNDAPLFISDMYFLYESLRFVNELLALSAEYEVAEITSLTLGDPSYVEDLGAPPLPWHDPSIPPPQPTPVLNSPYTFGQEKRTQLVLGKVDTSLGYCLPVFLQFRATNRVGWNFLYEILRRYRLAEIDELRISSIKESESGELIWRVRVLHIPLLFATDVEPKPKPTPSAT